MKYPSINQSNVFVLNCMHCSFHTLLLSSLQEHIRDVHPNQDCYYSLYQCEHCGIISTSSNLLIEHTSLMHGDKQASVTCIYQGNNEPDTVTAFTCVFCEHTSGSPADMTLHYSNFHGVRNVSPIHLKTRALGISSAAASRTRNARAEIKPETKVVETNRQVLDVGMNGSLTEAATRELADAENGNGHWKCRNCGKEYDKKKYFVEHMIACVKSMKLVCVCGRTCKWRSNFYAHRKRGQFPKVDSKRETMRSGFSDNYPDMFSPEQMLRRIFDQHFVDDDIV